jgi:tetratricopeptide (TPR) repeat protein
MLTAAGHAVLLDFGIAKVVASPLAAGDTPTTSDATTGNSLIGTPSYMAPEQIQQRPVDGRTDLFALGVLLYECFTGRRPFDGPTAFETVANVLHRQPPPPSSMRAELTDRHDALCARLLAKDPADRFQSADEVVGAIRLLRPDTSRVTDITTGPSPTPVTRTHRRAVVLTVSVAAVLLAGTVWRWTRAAPLPAPPAEAEQWYARGTEAIREGAYQKATLALNRAVHIFPDYVLAYARLADAEAELDDQGAAQAHLLQASDILRDESRLPQIEQLRLRAVRDLVMRHVDSAIVAYQKLAATSPKDASAWLDLGRAQESAGLRRDARASYETATRVDSQYAPAFMRLGYVAGQEDDREQAIAAFSKAEELFKAASNEEGLTELLLKRGAMFDALGDYTSARTDLHRAITSTRSTFQRIRATLTLADISASEGHALDAIDTARRAVSEATTAGLETVAADGLIDLAASLAEQGKSDDARASLARAIELASKHRARRIAARAELQLASFDQFENKPQEALQRIGDVLPFLRDNQYRRLELTALSISSRARQRMDMLDAARRDSVDVLAIAEKLRDEERIALAVSNLASITTSLGDLPAALALRERAEGLRRRQKDASTLPYELANRAELLIRMGRSDDASPLLGELDREIEAGRWNTPRLANFVSYLHALAGATSLHCESALRAVARLTPDENRGNMARTLGAGIQAFCAAHAGRRIDAETRADAPTDVLREQCYWLGLAALSTRNAALAAAEAERGLKLLGTVPDHELAWRLAAIGAAATRAGTGIKARTDFLERARTELGDLRQQWQTHVQRYVDRPELRVLRSRAALP